MTPCAPLQCRRRAQDGGWTLSCACGIVRNLPLGLSTLSHTKTHGGVQRKPMTIRVPYDEIHTSDNPFNVVKFDEDVQIISEDGSASSLPVTLANGSVSFDNLSDLALHAAAVDAVALLADIEDLARGDVARHQVSVGGVFLF